MNVKEFVYVVGNTSKKSMHNNMDDFVVLDFFMLSLDLINPLPLFNLYGILLWLIGSKLIHMVLQRVFRIGPRNKV